MVKLNIKLTVLNNSVDTLVLYLFHKLIPSDEFVCDNSLVKDHGDLSHGLEYFIEDAHGNIIPAKHQLPPSYKFAKDEIRAASINILTIDTNKLKIKGKQIEDSHEYELGKLQINSNKGSFIVYPLISEFHYLPQGEYILYLVYSFHEHIMKNPPSRYWDTNQISEKKIFRGKFVSNKIRLIIE